MKKAIYLILSLGLIGCSTFNPQDKEYNSVQNVLKDYPELKAELKPEKGIYITIKEQDLCDEFKRKNVVKGIKALYKSYAYNSTFTYDVSHVADGNIEKYKGIDKKIIKGKKNTEFFQKICKNKNITPYNYINIMIPPNNKAFYEI